MISVGRIDGKLLTKEESGIGRECKKRKFKTLELALRFLQTLPEQDLYNGMYYLDMHLGKVVKDLKK